MALFPRRWRTRKVHPRIASKGTDTGTSWKSPRTISMLKQETLNAFSTHLFRIWKSIFDNSPILTPPVPRPYLVRSWSRQSLPPFPRKRHIFSYTSLFTHQSNLWQPYPAKKLPDPCPKSRIVQQTWGKCGSIRCYLIKGWKRALLTAISKTKPTNKI